MITNKVKSIAKYLLNYFDEFRKGIKPSERYYEVKNYLDSIVDIANRSTRTYPEMVSKLHEYMCDVADYIRVQSRGRQTEVGLVFKSHVIENEEGVSCVVSVEWGTCTDRQQYIVDCKAFYNQR